MFNVTDRYHHDGTFRRVVDQLRALLGLYPVTPSELHEAVILAATMHDAENIKPLFIAVDEYGPKLHKEMMAYMLQSSYLKPPAMFGGVCIEGCVSGRTAIKDNPNFTEQDKYTCICGSKDSRWLTSNKELHSQTCKDYNWSVTHPHDHFFSHIEGRDYRVCSCGISDVYHTYVNRKKHVHAVRTKDSSGNKVDGYSTRNDFLRRLCAVATAEQRVH